MPNLSEADAIKVGSADVDAVYHGDVQVWPLGAPPAASLSAKRGSFVCDTDAGDQAVTGVGFQPKAVIFLTARVTSADGTANANMVGSFGVGTDEAEEWAVAPFSLDAAATSDTARRYTAAACISLVNDAVPTVDAEAAYVSSDADGFTINWSAAPDAAYVVEYLALGGDAITGVDCGFFSAATSTGNQSITGVGFQPKLLLFGSGLAVADPPQSGGGALLAFGAAVSSSQRGGVGWFDVDGAATTSSFVGGSDERAVALATSVPTVNVGADLVSMNADGWTHNVTAAGSARRVSYLALGGSFDAAVVADAQKTSTGTQAKTGVGFAPKALLAFSHGLAALAADASTDQQSISINVGITDGAGQESSISLTSLDAAADSVAKRSQSQTKFLRFRRASDSVVLAECDVSSLDADGYTLNWPTADATAREFIVVAVG